MGFINALTCCMHTSTMFELKITTTKSRPTVPGYSTPLLTTTNKQAIGLSVTLSDK